MKCKKHIVSNAKIKQILEYTPSRKFVKYFNKIADGYSHNFRYDEKSDKIFFSALTLKCGCINIYADSTKQMEQDFIQAIKKRKNKCQIIYKD